jgi:hypothetical protein
MVKTRYNRTEPQAKKSVKENSGTTMLAKGDEKFCPGGVSQSVRATQN